MTIEFLDMEDITRMVTKALRLNPRNTSIRAFMTADRIEGNAVLNPVLVIIINNYEYVVKYMAEAAYAYVFRHGRLEAASEEDIASLNTAGTADYYQIPITNWVVWIFKGVKPITDIFASSHQARLTHA
jgi:hypothetical protein